MTDINFQAISLKVAHEVIAVSDDGGVLNFEWVAAMNDVSYILPNVFFVPVFGLDVTFLNDEKKVKRQIYMITRDYDPASLTTHRPTDLSTAD